MNFSSIPDNTAFGRLLRLPLRLIPPETTMPILQGALKRKRWIVGAGNHGCWLGSYEYEKRRVFERTVREGSVVFDVGAHSGFYTLLASVLAGPRGKVFAFEPDPRNVRYLEAHLRMNEVKNVRVIGAAVSDHDGVSSWEEGANSSTGHLAPEGARQVRTLSLDAAVARVELPAPDIMKIDVEGAEMLVLSGARCLLRGVHPILFLATHGWALHHQCCSLLTSLGYQLKAIGRGRVEDCDEILAFPPKFLMLMNLKS